MKSHIYTTLLVIGLILSACSSAPAVPTVDAASIQNTAVAAAFTVVAQTQAAIPTNTPIPPTETSTATPPPTDTPVPTETSALTVLETATSSIAVLDTPTPAASGGGDPCNQLLKADPLGKKVKNIKLENQTGAPITASIYLNLTPIGECGFRGYNIAKGGAVNITDLVFGCYNVSVYVNDPKKPTKSFGYGCINNPDQWTFVITRDSVVLQGR